MPAFEVFEVGPGPRFPLATYISAGCWDAVHAASGHGLEFILSAPVTDRARHVEVLTMAAYYHAGQATNRLDHGHTVPIGEPWIAGSRCDRLLVSLPYAYGPDLETYSWEGGHARLLSLIPITASEFAFKRAQGLDALESRLEDKAVDFTDPARLAVV